MALPTTVLQFPDISTVPGVFTETDQELQGLAGYYKALGYSDTVNGVRLRVADFVSRVIATRYSNDLIRGLSVSTRPPCGDNSNVAGFDIAISGDIFFRKWKPEIAEDSELVGALLGYMETPAMEFLFSIENPQSMAERIIDDHLYGYETKEEALKVDPDRDPDSVFTPEEIKEMLASDFSASDRPLAEITGKLGRFGISSNLQSEMEMITSCSEHDYDGKPLLGIYIANDTPSSVETLWVEDSERSCMESYGIGYTANFDLALSADTIEAAYQFDQACGVIHKACREVSGLIYKTTDWAFDG